MGNNRRQARLVARRGGEPHDVEPGGACRRGQLSIFLGGQVDDVARAADAAVVGSAIVDRLALNLDPDDKAKPGLVDAVLADIRALAAGIRTARKT